MRRFVHAIVLATFVALPVFAQPTAEEISRYPHREAEKVYRAVLDDVFRSGESPQTILLADSLGGALAHIDTLNPGVFVPPPGFDHAAFRNFLRVTSAPYRPQGGKEFARGPLPQFAYPVRLTRLTGDDLKALHASRHADTVLVMRHGTDRVIIEEEPFWTEFRRRFPESWGFTVLTRVGFNPELTHAFVQIMHRCYADCTSVESVFLRKAGNRWVVEKRLLHPEQSREGFPPGKLRYVGKGGWMRAANARFETVRRKEVADSLRREGAPRRIRGRLVNALTGKGMAGHPVYQLLNRDDNPDRVALTDKQGRFTLPNPAIGGWFLSIQCDETFGNSRSLADAGFYLGPGVDTTIVFEARSLSPCWKRRIHPIQSGEVESGLHYRSPYPDSTEAAVYAAVIDALFPEGHRRPLLRSHTVARCWFDEMYCDGTSHFALLLRERSADSSTVQNYDRAWRERVPFSSAFASRNTMELLTPTIARYLTDEAIAATRDQNSHVDEAPFWYGLRQAYPNAHGILSFTRIGFDLQRTEALVTVRHERNRLVSTHQTLLLRLDGNSWRVVRGNLEHERIGAEVDDGRCVIARGEPAPRVAQPAGVYDFTFVATDGRVERERLDASKARRWGHGGWDFSLGRRLMRIGTHHTDRLSGTWMNIGSDGIPIDSGRNRIPERNGHFCASPVEPGAPRD